MVSFLSKPNAIRKKNQRLLNSQSHVIKYLFQRLYTPLYAFTRLYTPLYVVGASSLITIITVYEYKFVKQVTRVHQEARLVSRLEMSLALVIPLSRPGPVDGARSARREMNVLGVSALVSLQVPHISRCLVKGSGGEEASRGRNIPTPTTIRKSQTTTRVAPRTMAHSALLNITQHNSASLIITQHNSEFPSITEHNLSITQHHSESLSINQNHSASLSLTLKGINYKPPGLCRTVNPSCVGVMEGDRESFCGKPGHKADFCWTRLQPNKVKHERVQFRFSPHETLIFSRRVLRRTQTLVPFVPFCHKARVDLILGNDLAGGQMGNVTPPPVLRERPESTAELQQLVDDLPGVFPLCAVTRSMSMTNDHNVTPDVDDSLSLGLFANPIASQDISSAVNAVTGRVALIAAQEQDDSLRLLFDQHYISFLPHLLNTTKEKDFAARIWNGNLEWECDRKKKGKIKGKRMKQEGRRNKQEEGRRKEGGRNKRKEEGRKEEETRGRKKEGRKSRRKEEEGRHKKEEVKEDERKGWGRRGGNRRREIGALEAENFSLERQLFSYQKSIAYAHSRGAYVDDPAEEAGEYTHEGYANGKRDYHTADYTTRDYDYTYTALPDRAFSTDTDYA
ncbi:hypothetical protein Hamer_G017323 [Homarus americanus]|uniref:Uncharacterized protein n=1 Tax=Homarus americanus TaxID=6706 RepID=A0A8J5MQC6_HOMAM|nr:hypothetical protein Hamer_G017323 [Homarus americanus]